MVKSNTPSDILDPVTKGKVEGDPSTDAVDFKKIDPSQTTVDADGKIVGTAVYVDTTVDYVKSQVWLKYAGKDAADIEVKAVLGNSSPADQMYLAARVALYEVGTLTELGTDMEFTACGTDSTNSATISMAAKTETPVGYDVYVWFEGSDTDCKNLNAVNGDTYSVTLKFNIKTSD
ncbi:MAG: hypothetical protein MJ236_06820 [Clostridia bacterium]|nr:hypothetical protein [Clostridia bacterium]